MKTLGMIGIALAALALAGCASGDRGLRDLDQGTTPDEFSVLPQRPLTLPDDLSSLPAPTPGGTNLTDPTPKADAILALGGRPGAGASGDAALLSHVGRNGVDPAIRADLADADAAFRQRRGRLGAGLFSSGDRYFSAYAGQALDAYAELERFRRLGVATPTAPPLD